MALDSLLSLVENDPVVLAARNETVVAVPENGRAVFLSAAFGQQSSPTVVIAPSGNEALRLADDLTTWLGRSVITIPAWETLPFERVSPSIETMGERLRALYELSRTSDSTIYVTTIKAVLQRIDPLSITAPIVVKHKQQLPFEQFIQQLGEFGYRREYQTEHRGEFSVRGSIVDVFPAHGNDPIRIDFWGDDIDRLTSFSIGSQRSDEEIKRVEIFPAREFRPTESTRKKAEQLLASHRWGAEQWERFNQGQFFEGMESWLPWMVDDEQIVLDFVPNDANIVLVEPRRLRDRAQEIHDEELALAQALSSTWNVTIDDSFPFLHVPFERVLGKTSAHVLSLPSVPDSPNAIHAPINGWDQTGPAIVKHAQQLISDQTPVIVCADGAGTAARISESMRDEGVIAPVVENVDLTKAGARVIVQSLDRGFIWSNRFGVVTETDITGRRRTPRRPKSRVRDAQTFYDDLKTGDYVVHNHHGVARYAGMVTRSLGGSERDYLLLEYRGDDKLYIPSDQIDSIRPYTGGEAVSLSRLGGADWARTKERVRKAVREIAQELLVLYQRRVHAPGYAFAPDTPWQHEMEEIFPYHETPDQLTAIIDVKNDMESSQPMDRLVCGDVGFGKTEVALRAAFKAVQDGKQVAILVPTTLLAQQHFQTFRERYSGYPVRVEVLSRFLTNAQAKKVTNGMADGTVDLVIGTHRLLSGDIKFKNLGLLIVDEEQRFGVMQKESIKKLRENVERVNAYRNTDTTDA